MVRAEAENIAPEIAEMIYFDTQVVAGLFDKNLDILSRQARRAVDRDDDLRMGPMVLLELQFLHEINRFRHRAEVVALKLYNLIGLRVCEASFADVARQALDETWTRDPFDRLIVAQARLKNARLVTRDLMIQQNYPLALD